MTDPQALITRCRELGAELIPTPEGKLKVKAPAPLPDAVRVELRQRKAEVFPLVEAMVWLRAKLTTPQHIAPLLKEWVGPLDQPTGRSMNTLMEARWTLGVVAYVGEDERFWWRLPQETVQ